MTYDVLAIGEILMDMTQIEEEGRVAFVANPGGAPLNAAIMASRLGAKTKFFGKVGQDFFGHQLVDLLEKEQVDFDESIYDKVRPTTLAFVQLDENGERDFTFYREGAADITLDYDELDCDKIDYRSLYFGSVAFTMSPLRETTLELVIASKKKQKILFYDPNYRPMLWSSEEKAIEWMKKGMLYADIVKVSEEEVQLITGEVDLEKALTKIHSLGPKGIFLTKGHKGVCVSYKGMTKDLPALKVDEVLDMTGAGDAFFGAVMGVLSRSSEALTWKAMIESAKVGIVAAGLSVKAYGAIPSYPTRGTIQSCLEEGII